MNPSALWTKILRKIRDALLLYFPSLKIIFRCWLPNEFLLTGDEEKEPFLTVNEYGVWDLCAGVDVQVRTSGLAPKMTVGHVSTMEPFKPEPFESAFGIARLLPSSSMLHLRTPSHQ
jgi:hypothetical protein